MKLKKFIFAIALLMVITRTTSANVYVYTFTLNGAGANGPNNNTGTAYGTLTLTDPNLLTLNMTYTGLSSDFQKVDFIFWLSPTSNLELEMSAPTDLPTSGQWTDTYDFNSVAGLITPISTGKSQIQLGTVNYPFATFGEIGGLINPSPVPEPSIFGIAFVVGATGLIFRALRKSPQIADKFDRC